MKIAILLVLFVAAVATCAGCGASLRGRRAELQNVFAVEVTAACQKADGTYVQRGGSGAVVGPRQVVTAMHVVGCPNASLLVTLVDGRIVPMRLAQFDFEADVALLVSQDSAPFGRARVVVAEPPDIGGEICAVAAVPHRTRRCGRITGREELPPTDLHFSAEVDRGNSGGGIYDGYGRLVGIVTHKTPSGGAGTSLWDRRALLGID